MSADVDSVIWICAYGGNLLQPLVRCLLAICFMWQLLGAAALPGAAFMSVMALINYFGFKVRVLVPTMRNEK